jgi:outer membrane protein assembly factor BamD (BamD/ComL family)
MKKNIFIVTAILFLMQACAATLTPHQMELYNADNLFNARKYDDAITAYKKILQEHPDPGVAADAQFAIAYTLIYYDNPNINYTLSMEEFNKFMALYPNDSRYQEAKNWYRALKTLYDTKKENAALYKKIKQLNTLDIQRERSIR